MHFSQEFNDILRGLNPTTVRPNCCLRKLYGSV
jgi:hypothetical protein